MSKRPVRGVRLYKTDEDEDVDETLQRLWEHANKHGYVIKDDTWARNQIYKMAMNGGVCPCRPQRGKCPCKESEAELKIKGKCTCSVFYNLQ